MQYGVPQKWKFLREAGENPHGPAGELSGREAGLLRNSVFLRPAARQGVQGSPVRPLPGPGFISGPGDTIGGPAKMGIFAGGRCGFPWISWKAISPRSWPTKKQRFPATCRPSGRPRASREEAKQSAGTGSPRPGLFAPAAPFVCARASGPCPVPFCLRSALRSRLPGIFPPPFWGCPFCTRAVSHLLGPFPFSRPGVRLDFPAPAWYDR